MTEPSTNQKYELELAQEAANSAKYRFYYLRTKRLTIYFTLLLPFSLLVTVGGLLGEAFKALAEFAYVPITMFDKRFDLQRSENKAAQIRRNCERKANIIENKLEKISKEEE